MLASDSSVENALADVRVSLGKVPADLLLRGCQLVNVWSEEVYAADIAIRGSHIVAIRDGYDGEARQVVPCEGRFVLPGFVEPHVHLPAQADPVVFVSRGITSLVLAEGSTASIDWQGPSPRRWQETSDRRQRSGVDGFAKALQRNRPCSTVAEASEAIAQGESVLFDTDPAKHASLLESISSGDVETARLMLRQYAGRAGTASNAFWAALRAGIAAGLSPARIAQLTSFNTATHFGIEHLVGSVSPGRLADILVFETLDSEWPAEVYLGGVKVAEQGRLA